MPGKTKQARRKQVGNLWDLHTSRLIEPGDDSNTHLPLKIVTLVTWK